MRVCTRANVQSLTESRLFPLPRPPVAGSRRPVACNLRVSVTVARPPGFWTDSSQLRVAMGRRKPLPPFDHSRPYSDPEDADGDASMFGRLPEPNSGMAAGFDSSSSSNISSMASSSTCIQRRTWVLCLHLDKAYNSKTFISRQFKKLSRMISV